jgi:methionyl-tRNA formyltransferase
VDLGVVVSFGHKLPPPVIDTFRKACLNVHPSRLPQYRGAAPIAQTILNGDPATAVSIIQLANRMDAGDIVYSDPVPVDPHVAYPELATVLAQRGAAAMLRVVGDIDAYVAARSPQTGTPTRAPKLHKVFIWFDLI